MKKIKKIILPGFIACCLLVRSGASFGNECNVRMLVLYTQSALTATWSGVTGINNLPAFKLYNAVKKSVDDINLSFANSAIGHTIVLAGIRQLRNTYSEPGCFFTMLGQLEATNDGYLDEVNALRDKYRADVVVLVVNDNSRCGLADNLLGPGHSFIVVNYNCLVSNWSLARQLGYLYQCGNHETQLEAEGAFFNTSGYGNAFGYMYQDYENAANSFTTIMGYTDEARSDIYDDYNLIPYWSNPNILNSSGIPVGDAMHNNAAAIKNTVFTVAHYRVSKSVDTLRQDTVQAFEYASGIAIDTLRLQTYSVKNVGTLDVVAATSVQLQPGFYAEYGSIVTIRTDASLKTCTLPSPTALMARQNMSEADAVLDTASLQPFVLPGEINSKETNNGVTVYPNPFTHQVTIRYSLAKEQRVNLFISDINGKPVAQLLSGSLQQAGQHQFVFDGSKLPSGIYLYRLDTGGLIKTGKIIKGK